MKVLFLELSDEDRARVERLAANSGAAMGRPVSMSDVMRQLVRDASKKGAPVRIRPEGSS
jgi:hypothetical protein